MSKKTLFISATLTAFVMVILVNVVSAYNLKSGEPTMVVQPTIPAPTEVVEVITTSTKPVLLTHQEAALVAANFLGDTDLFSVENAPWEDEEAFKVVFSSGYVVFVSLDGQILNSEAPLPVIVSVPALITDDSNNDQSSGSNNGSNNDDDDDDHDDDENEDEDDEDEHEDEPEENED